MIKNNWRALIDRAGIKQRAIAERIGVSAGMFSQAVTGQSVMDYGQFIAACEVIGCKPESVYDAEFLECIYHIAQKPRKAPSTVSVRIPRERAEEIDRAFVESGIYVSRNEAVNALLGVCLNDLPH